MTKTFLLSVCCFAALLGCNRSVPVDQDRPGASPATEPEPEHPAGGLTAMDQSNEAEDLRVTTQIRQSSMADSALSFAAKNVKVIRMNRGAVLRGVVKSVYERDAIAGYAHAVAGVARVDNLPEVSADDKSMLSEGKVRGGNILIATHIAPRDGEQSVRELLHCNGAHDIVGTSETMVPRLDSVGSVS